MPERGAQRHFDILVCSQKTAPISLSLRPLNWSMLGVCFGRTPASRLDKAPFATIGRHLGMARSRVPSVQATKKKPGLGRKWLGEHPVQGKVGCIVSQPWIYGSTCEPGLVYWPAGLAGCKWGKSRSRHPALPGVAKGEVRPICHAGAGGLRARMGRSFRTANSIVPSPNHMFVLYWELLWRAAASCFSD